MPTFRTFRSAFLYLGLLLVASCQPDKPTRTEQAVPALADTLTLDSTANPMGATDTAAARRNWHRLAKPTSRNAPLVVYRSVRRPPAGLAASPAPGEATLFDIGRKASEYFQIDPTKAAEVRGRSGTVVRLAAGTLVDAAQRAATGPVWVELKECYTPAEMVLTNLTTLTTDNQLLQTGGMVLVKATAAGRPLQVAEGRTMRLEIPAAKGHPLPGMQLYYGQATTPVRWVAAPATTAPPVLETVYTEARPMPAYGNGPADINRLIRYPREALVSQIQGVVFASFVVDESGRVQQPHILRGIGHGCDEEVLRVLRQTSGHWMPGQRNGEFVKVKMVLPIRFSFQPGQLSTDTSRRPLTDAEPAEIAAAPSEEPAEAAPTDRYVFNCAQLGWLNVDRPVSAGTVSLLAATAPDDATTVRLVLPGATPTVVAADALENGYQFSSIPAGRRGVVVGLRYVGGVPYLAWQEVTTGQEALAPLEFEETTLEELERRLERL
ncbi:TonB family protein [Hymenobacter sp. BT186]|uniref:TonB family protein n=1 Tax=Hymenobacter telluris TaxID=2816474 RepID=A0A939F165_9BACT|nr:energy transducer TonB [Hymenobacter telluris]MBO0360891.1 TonB family protein [Hymenobacter telluris]MBW3376920.1 energy transducer TonB [Hymenobacter norwichensis]